MPVRRIRLSYLLAFSAGLLACGKVPADPGSAYVAVLRSPLQRVHWPFALQPILLTDTGEHGRAGTLDHRIVSRLITEGLVAEICREGDLADEVPSCLTDSATTAVRFSRLLPTNSGTVLVRIGAWTVHPRGDTSLDTLVAFGTQEECTLRQEAGGWQVLSCRHTMIT